MIMGGLGIDAEERRRVGREREAQRRKDKERDESFRERRRFLYQRGTDDLFGVEWKAETVIGKPVDGQQDDGALTFGQGGEIAPFAMGPGGVGVSVGEPGSAHEAARLEVSGPGASGIFGALAVATWPGSGRLVRAEGNREWTQ